MLYPKIESPFRRFVAGPERNSLDLGAWSRPEFELLKDLPWEWTEKVNGTNVRVIWDGYKVRFGGRTDNASMPIKLVDMLTEQFPEEILEQKFGSSEVTLFGEGYGPGIAAGSGIYNPSEVKFVLFDVWIGGWWLLRDNVTEVASSLAIDVVPLVGYLDVGQAIRIVTDGLTSGWGGFLVEGLVGKAPLGLLSRGKDRLVMKVKTKDFRHG
jgi:hypothetical protein